MPTLVPQQIRLRNLGKSRGGHVATTPSSGRAGRALGRLALRAAVFFTALASGAWACGKSAARDPDILSLLLDDRTSLADILPAADAVALLVYDPGDCLACGNPIGLWRRWEQEQPGRALMLVLTRKPSDSETLALATVRISPSGVLAPRQAERLVLPAGYYIVNGTVRDFGFTRAGAEGLLSRMVTTLPDDSR